ncbi:quinolinate synthetase complex, A subunit [Alkaliphilus metalliredigens QYMF]|uniref:Quinolinate synthase n=1 Tax=Alkaliphilus metalliredigens (strain QYMF) TaxID=293826 RepID=NADA_ALKMQ|nr:quinolinate synthase NadA [Alkaliphilus metalliredigens]A6TJ92.1 RecName: Full=Quinolinate synthase [Alkaliphilus metalliredigens QYMF]ABR46260.1 quinolinate synthetase complex, A subunit [Alkaliphilus metalliredigens QYMF]
MNETNMIDEIKRLKKEKNAVILAHNYQIPEIQEIADIVGDSLKLSQEATKTDADIVVLSGVKFMAESVKILSPNKKVLLPAHDAGCPMADMIDVDQLKEFKAEYPNVPVVCYVNSSAEVKAESDICCTSSNAIKVVRSLQSDKVIFVPDQNLAAYIAEQVPEKEIIPWQGFCITHHRVKDLEVDKIRKQMPEAVFLVHPECTPDVVKKADFVGSTSQIIQYAKESNAEKFVIGTEMGVLHKLKKENPTKKFYLLSPGLICFNMKKTTLVNVYEALRDEQHEIIVDEYVREKALKTLNQMLEIK